MCPPLLAAVPALLAGGGAAAGGAAAAGITATQAMTALSLVTAATSVYAQQQTAKAQTSAITTQAEREREEVSEAAEEEIGQRIRESRERRARATVAAGESGALGASFAASINQSLQDQDMDAALISKQAAFSQRGIDDRANTALAGIRSPSALEAGLQIATAGISGYRSGLGIESLRTAEPTRTSLVEGGSSTIPRPSTGLTVFGDPKI